MGATTSLSNTADHEAAHVAHGQTCTHTIPLTQLDLYAPILLSSFHLCAALAMPYAMSPPTSVVSTPVMLGAAYGSLGAHRPPIDDSLADHGVAGVRHWAFMCVRLTGSQ